MTKINFHQAWEHIFETYNLLERIEKYGYVDISADALKAVDAKEPRNLTKIDFRERLPHIMQRERLSVLAIKNGLYRIAKNDPFIDINAQPKCEITTLAIPDNLLSLDPFNIRSESAALDLAALSGMLDSVFQEKSRLTLRGRLRGELNFSLGAVTYDVDGVQIEVDGGYEGAQALHIIEAKIGYSNNINIRQLLYPQRYWEMLLAGKKAVKSYIFYLQDDLFRFIPYIYDGCIGYADHEHEQVFRFQEPKRGFSLYTITVDLTQINATVPFPQADRFELLHTMLLLLGENEPITKEFFALHFDIVDRQIDYYLNALRWLGLLCEESRSLALTPKGKKIVSLPFMQRVEALATIVLSDLLANRLLHGQDIDPLYFQHYNIYSPVTIKRRLRTINAWIKYFKALLDEA
jgi:hypothetical protein